jgi:signal recognition particle subunit SRP9
MVFVKNWEEFETVAENMYLNNPSQCRFSMKYTHCKQQLLLKVTDNVKVKIVAEIKTVLIKIPRFLFF